MKHSAIEEILDDASGLPIEEFIEKTGAIRFWRPPYNPPEVDIIVIQANIDAGISPHQYKTIEKCLCDYDFKAKTKKIWYSFLRGEYELASDQIKLEAYDWSKLISILKRKLAQSQKNNPLRKIFTQKDKINKKV